MRHISKILELSKEISTTIRELRSKSNKSQSEIATLMGMSQSAYSRLENDPSKATLEQLVQLAEVYDIELSFLLGADASEREYYKYYTQVKKLTDQI